ncbi:MAG: LamG-like jellyroll fold domain-containing protein, partial [Cyclobacteriaceae bacterium]
MTYNLDLTNGFTVEQWINTSNGTATMLVNQTNSNIGAPLDVYTNGTGGVTVFLGNGGTWVNTSPNLGMVTNTWYHIAIVYDPASSGSQGKVYFNGNATPVATINTNSQSLANVGPIRIGSRADGFEGADIYTDEVRIWSKPRSGAEIAADYNRRLTGNETDLDIYYQFENNLADLAGGDHNGTAVGSIGYHSATGPPLVNYALDFDGLDDVVTIGDNIEGLSAVTMEAWVYYTETSAVWNEMCSKNVVNSWGISPSHKMWWHVGDGFNWSGTAVEGTSTIPINTWTHVAITWDGTTTRMYINGMLDHTEIHAHVMGTNTSVRGIGNYGHANSNPFQGSIDELRLWDVVRTESQINAFKNIELNGPEPGLLAYYDFSDGPGSSTLTDQDNTPGTYNGSLASMDPATDWITASFPLSAAGSLDTVDPTISSITGPSSPTSAYPIGISIEFSEQVTNFEVGDLTVGNGTAANLATTDSITWTADITPTTSGQVTVDIAADALTDFTGNGNTAAPPYSIDSEVNFALSFDGIDDRVLIPDNPALEPTEGKLTIEAWIFPTTDSPHQRIVTKGDGNSAGTDDGSFFWDTYDNTAGARGLRAGFANSNDVYVSTPTTGEILTLNQWHHVALVFDQGVFTNYLNGVAVSSADLGETTLVDNNVDWAIGEDAVTSNEHFNGQMDEVRIWHSVRTPSQLLAFKDVELTGNEPGLVAYYPMEVNSMLTDVATTGASQAGSQDGTINGPTQIVSTEMFGAAVLDTQSPTITMITGPSSPTTNNPIGITITFDEQVTNFAASDLTVGGGSASNLATSDNITWTADITPITGTTVTVDLPEDAVTDLTGNGNTAANQYQITFTSPENALNFDGVDDYVDLGNSLAATVNTTFAVEAWIYPESIDATNGNIIFNKWTNGAEDKLFSLTTSGQVTFGLFGAGGVTSTQSIGLNQWTHVAGVYDGSNMIVYINGIQDAQSAATGNVADNVGVVYVGGNPIRPNNEGGYFDGEIDNLRVWSVARSAADIVAGLTTQILSATGLDAAYDFNATSGTTLTDISGNGNTGNVLGDPSWIASTTPSCAPGGTFIGTTDSDWDDPANWCGGVVPPPSNVVDDVVIAEDATLTQSENLVLNANNFIVQEGASLNMDLNNNTLELQNAANFINNGNVFINDNDLNLVTGGTFTNNGTVFFAEGTQVDDPLGAFINNGVVTGFGTFNNNFINQAPGTVAPGASPGCTNFGANFTNIGTLEVDVDGTTPCTGYDQITVGGTATLGGTLNVNLGYTPTNGDEIVILDATAISGTFGTVNLPDGNWSIAYNSPTTGEVSLNYNDPTQLAGSTGPGGVGETDGASTLTLWYQADKGVFADAGVTPSLNTDPVDQWNDQSGYGTHTTVSASPTYQTGGQNGQPNINFAGSEDLDFDATDLPTGANARSVFVVAEYSSTPGGQEYLFSYGANTPTNRFSVGVDASNSILLEMQGSGYIGAASSVTPSNTFLFSADYSGGALSNSNMFVDGAGISATGGASTPNTTNVTGSVGALAAGSGLGFNGDIYEVIFFNEALNTASRTIIENYLSAKYALTITGDHYAGDDGGNGDFDFDVAGIGQEVDGYDPAANSGGLFLMSEGFLQDNGDYAFAGHTGTAHAMAQTDLPGGYLNRWARDWYVDLTDVNSNNGSITFTFDYDDAGLTRPSSNFALITRPSTSGAYTTASTNFAIEGNKVSFTLDASAIVDGHKYTIADDNMSGNALSFDGADDYVSIPDDVNINSGVVANKTIEAWFNVVDKSPASFQVIYEEGGEANGLALYIYNNELYFFSHGGSNVLLQTSNFVSGSWNHVAIVIDSDNTIATGYLNGSVFATDNTGITVIPTHSANIGVGAMNDRIRFHDNTNEGSAGTQNYFYEGEIDELRIWNVARTQAEIVNNAYSTLTAETGLVASYDFNQSAGPLTDVTAGTLDGTLFGGATFVTSDALNVDVFPPLYDGGYPVISNLFSDNADLAVALNETGVAYYSVLPDGDPTPTSSGVQAGGVANEITSGSFTISASATEFVQNITGLTMGTAYDVYVVAADDEGNLQSNPTLLDVSTGDTNYALDLDGIDDHISGSGIDLSSKDFTVEVWFNTDNASANQTLFSMGSAGTNNQALHITIEQTQVKVGFFFDDITIPWSVTTGWHHLVITHEFATLESSLYIDGSYVGSDTHGSAFIGNTNFTLSRNSWDPSGYFDGQMDEVRLWDVVRAEAQIAAFKDVELTGSEPELLGYYNFNSGTGSTLFDIATSDGAQDGTWSGPTLPNTSANWVLATNGVTASQGLDTTDPTVLISSSESGTTTLSPFPITFTFDEEVVDFKETDITVGNGVAANLQTADNVVFLADVYPSGDGTVLVDLFLGKVTDLTGNDNATASQFSINASLPQNALTFDGFNDFVDISDVKKIDDAVDDYTLEAWFNASDVTTADSHTILSYANSFSTAEPYANISVSETAIVFSKRTNAAGEALTLSGPAPIVGEWYHVAAVKNGSMYSLYVNGESVDSNTSATSGTYNRTKVYIGAFGAADTGNEQIKGFFDGSIDEVKLWNDARSASEVLDDMYEKYPTTADNLEAYWSFDNSGGELLIDQGPNGYHSQLFGEFGVVSSATNNTVISKSNTPLISSALDYGLDDMSGSLIRIIDDNPVLVEDRILASNTNNAFTGTNTFTITQDWTTNPAANTSFAISYNNPVWVTSGAPAIIPFQVTAATTSGVQINWSPIPNADEIFVDIATDPGFSSQIVTADPVTNVSAGSYTLTSDFSGQVGNQLYARLQYTDGSLNSANSDTVSFFITPGNALDFDGTNDFVDLGTSINTNTIDGATTLTVEAWVNIASFGVTGQIISNSLSGVTSGLELRHGVTGDVIFTYRDNDGAQHTSNSLPLTAGTWHHVAGVLDGTNLHFYLDGQAAGVLNFPSAIGITTAVNSLKIGANASGQESTGRIDEVRIWNLARSQSEIQETQYSTLVGNETGLVSYYRFDQGLTENDNTGIDVLPDLAGNNDGSLENFDLTDAIVPIVSNWVASDAMDAPGPAVFNATQVTTSSLVVDFTAPTEATEVLVDVSEDPTFMSVLYAEDISVGTIGFATVKVSSTLSEGTQYYYRAKAIFAGGSESDYVVSNAFMVTPGYALDFDGTDDYVQGPNLDGYTGLTFEAWVYPTADVTGAAVGGLYNSQVTEERWFMQLQNLVPRFNVSQDFADIGVNVTATESIPLNTWTHLAGVWNGGSDIKIYVNGIDMTGTPTVDGAPGSTLFDNSLPFLLGTLTGGSGTNTNHFVGRLDEARVWSVARTESEIQNNLFKEVVGNDTGLEAYYRFDEFTGSNLPDLSINSNNGTWNGSGGANTIPNWVASDAMKPVTYQATEVSVNGFRVNWDRVTTASQVLIEWDDDTDFSDATFVDIAVSDPTDSTFFVVENLTSRVGQPLYYRLKIDNGGGFGSYSDPVEFWVTPGFALDFDGTDDYVDLDVSGILPISDATDTYTIEMWVKGLPQNNSYFFSEWSGALSLFGMATGGSGNEDKIAMFKRNGGGSIFLNQTGTTSVMDGRWHHLAYVNDGADGTLYVDGIFEFNDPAAGNTNLAISSVLGSARGAGNFFDGEMDEVRIWDVARSQQQIEDNRYNTISRDANLVAYYQMDATGGTLLEDLSANGYNGTLTNDEGDEWVPSGALSPVQYQISEASDQGFRVNWQATNAPGNVFVDINDASDFSSTMVVDAVQIGAGTDATSTVVTSLSPNQQYFARVYIQDGDFQSAYSDTLSFYTGPGFALDLDGTDDHVSVPTSTDFEFTSGTVEAWVRPSTSADNKVIAGIRTDAALTRWSIHINEGADNLGLWNGSGFSTVGATILPDTWYHVAFVLGASDTEVFLNGSSLGLLGAAMSSVTGSPFVIGSPGNSNPNEFFVGEVDEVRVWNVERTQVEISSTVFSTLSGDEPGLVAYYRLDETSGTNLPDLTSSAHDGALLNGLTNTPAADGTTNGPAWIISAAMTSTTPPVAPDSLIAYRSSATELTLEWADQSNDETGFIIERADDEGFSTNVTPVGNVAANVTTATFDVGADQPYYFRVTASNSNGSNASGIEFGTTELHPGYTMSFLNGTDRVNVTNPSAFNGNTITAEAWIKTSKASGLGRVVVQGDGGNQRWSLSINWPGFEGKAVAIIVGSTTNAIVTGTSDVNDGLWHHVAGTYNLSTGETKIYVDGQLENTDFAVGTPHGGTFTAIGNWGPTIDNQELDGEIDDLRIWGSVKTDFSDRFTPLSGIEADLISYYPFDENNAGGTVFDRSVNQNNGTPVNSQAYTPSGAIAPSGLVTTDISTSQIDLTWTDNTDAETGFTIERSDDGATGWAGIATVGTDVTVHTDLSVSTNEDYFYRVRADLPGAVPSGYTAIKAASTRALPGNSLDFDGGNDYVLVPDNPDLDIASGTVEAWVKVDAALIGNNDGLYRTIMANNPQYGMWMRNGELITYDEGIAQPISSAVSIDDGNWHHVAFVWEDGVASASQLYVDGATAGSAFTYNSLSSNFELQIGANTANQFWSGEIDEVRIWSSKRTAQEIADNQLTELLGTEQDLLAYYQFDTGVPGGGSNTTVTTLYDRSVHLNNGTLNTFGLGSPTPGESNWVTSAAMTPAGTPLDPTALIAYKQSDTEIVLEWQHGLADVSDFIIERADDFAFSTNVVQVATVAAPMLTYTHTVTDDDGFFYRVSARNGANVGAGFSNVEFGTVEDFPGQALSFDGVGNYTNAPESFGVLTSLTVEAWVYPRSFGGSSSWVYWRGNTSVNPTGGEIFITSTGIVGYGESDVTNQTILSSTAIPLNQWSHLAVVKAGGSAQLYINGVADGSSGTIDGSPPNGEISLGARVRTTTDGYFDGLIDEVRIWDTNRTPTQVQDNLYNDLLGTEANLIVYYKMDEGVGSKLVDRSENTIDGDITGATYVNSDFTSPSQLIVERVDNENVQLTWQDNSDEDGFIVVRADDAVGTNLQEIATLGPDVTTYTDNIGPDATAFYVVRSFKGDDESESVVETSTSTVFPAYALDFDGVDDEIVTPFQENLDDFTIETWVKFDDFTNTQRVIDLDGNTGNDYWTIFHVAGSGVLTADLRDSGSPQISLNSPALNVDQWYHVAYVRNASSILLYLDGVQVDIDTEPAFTFEPVNPLRLGGAAQSVGQNTLDGSLDEVRVWTVAKDATYFSNGEHLLPPVPNDADLAAYYAFDENIGELVIDRTVNDNSGAWVGTNSPNTAPNWILSGASPGPPMNVTATIPTANATNVAANQVVSVDFDADTDLSSVTNNTTGATETGDDQILISGSVSGLIEGTWALGGDNSIVDFTPAFDYINGEVITVSVLEGVRGIGGEVPTALTQQFTVVTGGNSDQLTLNNTSIGTTEDSRNVQFADVNRDGFADLIIADGSTTHIKIFTNDAGAGDPADPFDTSTSPSTVAGGALDRTVSLGDMNGDAYPDILVGTNGVISLYLNDGSGAYDGTADYVGSISGNTYAIAIGDIDNDGDQDFIAQHQTEQDIYLYENDGTGINYNVSMIGAGDEYQNPLDLVLGDIDNDGWLDLVVGNSDTNVGGSETAQSTYYLNDQAAPYFSSFQTFGSVADKMDRIALGDVNGDNYLDLVAVNARNSSRMVYFENQQSASPFTASSTFGFLQATVTTGFSNALALGDMDGDGDLDAVVGYDGSGSTMADRVFYWDGSAFGPANDTGTLINSNTGNTTGVALADLDNDQDLEVVFVKNGSPTLIYLNQDIMQVTSSVPLANANDVPSNQVVSIDFDSDVDLTTVNSNTVGPTQTLDDNIIISGSQSGIIEGTWALGSDNSIVDFTPSSNYRAGEIISVVVTDAVIGAAGDLAVATSFSFRVGTSSFKGDFVVQSTSLEGVVDGAAAWADYDADGDLDIVVSGWDFEYNVAITKIFNNSGGTFTDIGASLTGVYEGSLDWGDYDNDGDLDLFVTGIDELSNTTATLYENNAGTFTDAGGSFQGVYFSEADWGDYDNDGDLDLIVQGQYQVTPALGTTNVYRNDAGTFVDISAGLAGRLKGGVVWGDYDNDGDLDFVHNGRDNTSTVQANIYQNDNGLFTDIVAGLDGTDLGFVEWGDYDNDGDLDLVVSGASSSDNAPKIYRNDAGSFVDINAGLLENAEGEIAWGDYDGDGDLDLVINGSGETNDPTSTIYTNNSGTFVNAGIPIVDYIYGTVDWGDYDNDGDLDLLVTGTDDYNGGRIALMANSVAPPDSLYVYEVAPGDLQINWRDQSGAEDGFTVVSSTSYDGPWSQVATGITDTFFVHSVGADVRNFYRVAAYVGAASDTSGVDFGSTVVFPGTALDFDGTGDNVDLGTSLTEFFDGTNQLTLEAWVFTTTANTLQTVIGNYDAGSAMQFLLRVDANVAQFFIGTTPTTLQGLNGVIAVPSNTWTHLAATYDGSTMRLYVNGVEDGVGVAVSTTFPTIVQPVTIGGLTSSQFFTGSIDEIKIWSTAKSDFSDRFSPFDGNEPNLVAYFPFDEEDLGTASDLVDNSVNTNDGVANGDTQYTTSFSESFTVTNTSDALVAGSLRQAITDANASTEGAVTIDFNITGGGPHTITPSTALPAITKGGVTIDGTTQSGYSAYDPQIILDGGSADFNGFEFDAAGFEVYGLEITGFTGSGRAAVFANNDLADGFVIGDVDKGNVLSGNEYGIRIQQADNGVIQANRIGTDRSGTTALSGNTREGIYLPDGSENIIVGGSEAGEGNLISGNNGGGIRIIGATTGTIIMGNYIGTTSDGIGDLGNIGDGIELGFSTVGSHANGTIIGGALAGERNIIAGNTTNGIRIIQGDNIQVIGNYVGTDVNGTSALANDQDGIYLGFTTPASTNLIQDNLISGNAGTGLTIQFGLNNQVFGNKIGTAENGTDPLPNLQQGITISSFFTGASADDNIIGGTSLGEANIIAYNGNDGIEVRNGDVSAAGNQIIGNSIFCNGDIISEFGIDLRDGGNNELSAPNILTFDGTTISGDGTSTGDEVHVYRQTSVCGTSPNPQGEEYLGTVTATGTTWTVSGLTLSPSDILLATRTNATDGTSEFSAPSATEQMTITTLPAVNGNVLASTNDNIIYSLSLEAGADPVTLNQVNLTTTGDYTGPAEIAQFELVYSVDNDLGTTGDNTSMGTFSPAAAGTGELLTFTSATPTIGAGNTNYLFLTANTGSGAISGRFVGIQAPLFSDFTFVSAIDVGSDLSVGESVFIAPSTPAPLGVTGMYFDGVDDEVTAGLPTTATDDVTLSAWIKSPAPAALEIVLYNGNSGSDGYGISREAATGKYMIMIGGIGQYSIEYTPAVNEWVHVSIVRDAGTWIAYINGVQTALGSAVPPPNGAPTGGFTMGRGTGAGFEFGGQLDEVKVFEMARTQAQVQADMYSTATNTTGLVGYWNLDDDLTAGNQTIASDVQTNTATNDGTVNGSLWSWRVTNILDNTSPGSLRFAMTESNEDADIDFIDFSIEQAGPWSIQPSAALPVISNGVII